MKFTEQEKKGEVMGNAVKAKPVPYALIRKLQAAREANDDNGAAEVMLSVVAKCVTMEDGSAIDTDELSCEAVVALFDFAIGGKGETIADFTKER